jgi:2-C-methyl-D-erythritol 2,4-cyclodiphosphate synthase
MRVGFGYDVHRMVEGRRLILGGVEIAHPKGPEGHSDADVLSHAIVDALLGAAAFGNIGTRFPNTDPAYKNISSLLLLSAVKSLLDKEKYRIHNVDSTVSLESPKLLSYIPSMREKIAGSLGVATDQVSVKATSGETLGFVGRGDGVVAYAVALIGLSKSSS